MELWFYYEIPPETYPQEENNPYRSLKSPGLEEKGESLRHAICMPAILHYLNTTIYHNQPDKSKRGGGGITSLWKEKKKVKSRQ